MTAATTGTRAPAARRARQLSPAHFAFMRNLVQGLPLRESWDRYLQEEGDAADLPSTDDGHTVNNWIRQPAAQTLAREIARVRVMSGKAVQHDRSTGTAIEQVTVTARGRSRVAAMDSSE